LGNKPNSPGKLGKRLGESPQLNRSVLTAATIVFVYPIEIQIDAIIEAAWHGWC
jgi:hypothetical protein